jgi:hypothetical protein
MDNVIIELKQSGTMVQTATTNASGNYTFANVCPGTYQIEITTGKPVGGINSTDAGQVNNWNVSQNLSGERPLIEKVRFLAGDVSGDFRVTAIDAGDIQEYFVKSGTSPEFDNLWEFWTVNYQVKTQQNLENNVLEITIPASSASVTQDFYGMVSGDFNRSYTPPTGPGSGRITSGTITLLKGETLPVQPGQIIDIPVKTGASMQVGAISLILNYPDDKFEITEVFLKDNPGQPVLFSAKNEELRIGWNSMSPLSLTKGETMLTVRLKVTSAFDSDEVCRFLLAGDPLNELANGEFEVIEDAVLVMDALELKKGVTVGIELPANTAEMLLNSYPNPFTGKANIEYTLPEEGNVHLEVTGILGNRMKILSSQRQNAGEYFINLDGNDLAPGIYLLTLRFENQNGVIMKTIRIVKQ